MPEGTGELVILALFDRLRVREPESFDHVHGLVEATKQAFRLRDRYLTDPRWLPHPPQRYLEPAFLDLEAAAIDRQRASRWSPSGGGGDTVWLGAADASGLVVSYIQSLYWEFGSGCVLRKTGVRYETPFSACSQCSVMFLNPAQFDVNSTTNPSVEMPPLVTPIRRRR